jgi:hypothetical protein
MSWVLSYPVKLTVKINYHMHILRTTVNPLLPQVHQAYVQSLNDRIIAN